jgi:pyruvate dehydrogenase E2 component (dihydrolipoamide acetyltransferase)
MATDVIMPALGMAQDTGKVVRWLKSEGDRVLKGEPLMEVETDKVTVEVEAPADGTLGAVHASEGDDVPVGQTVALILAPNEEAPRTASKPSASTPSEAPVRAAVSPEGPSTAVLDDRRSSRPLASPKARRLAAEQGVDLAAVSGSGPHGAVVAADVQAAGGRTNGPGAPAPEPLPVGSLWLRMAERTAESWRSAPHFFLMREVDAGRLLSWRENVRARPGHERVTHTDLLVKLCAEALRRHPRVNAAWRNGTVEPAAGVNVGVAVATEEGLVVPVIHEADRLTLGDVAKRRGALVSAARDGALRPDDVAGGTFTLSNLGMYGVDAFLAVLNPPQAAILAVGRIAERVAAVDGVPAVRPTLVLTLSFDHRVVDGARGAEFLDTLASLVEEPAGLVA